MPSGSMTVTTASYSGFVFTALLLICVYTIAFWTNRARQRGREPAAFDLIHRMTDADQIYFQGLVITKGKIGAIKELRARFPVSLKTAKDTIELLDLVRPALLKLG